MGTMTREDVMTALGTANPRGRPDEIAMYADVYLTYQEAARNIAEHGAVVLHPRTGAPIDNPYLRVRDTAMAQIRRLSRVKVDGLW